MLVSIADIKLMVLGGRNLLPCWIGPLWITKRIGIVAYPVQLLSIFKIHDVFHVSLLWLYIANGSVQPPPLPIFEENASYEIKRMLSHEGRGSRSCPKKIHFIRWLIYRLEHNSCELDSNLSVEKLKEYWDELAKSEDKLTRHAVKCDHEASAAHKRLRQKTS